MGILPLHLSGWNTEVEGRVKQKGWGGGEEELEFSYGIAKETAERKEKIGFQ